MADKTSPILTMDEMEIARLLTSLELASVNEEATRFATNEPAGNLEESKWIYEAQFRKLTGILAAKKVARAQAKKVAEWGNEKKCPHMLVIGKPYLARRLCSKCWQLLLEKEE